MSETDWLAELAALLIAKAEELDRMAATAGEHPRYTCDAPRLHGKAEGVRLALSFVEEYRRGDR